MKRLFCFTLSVIFCVSLVISCAISSAALTPTEARNSIVCIYSSWDTSAGTLGAGGTGFAVGKMDKPVRYIVTNAHVVYDMDYGLGPATSVSVCFNAATNDVMVCEIAEIDLVKDLAILELPQPTTERVPLKLCPIADFDMEDEVAALGYPSIAELGANFLAFDQDDVVITRGKVARQNRNSDLVEVYLLDVDISEGNSGGPAINEAGDVIGIVTYYYKVDELNNSANYAVCVDELIPMLNSLQVPYTLSTEKTTGFNSLILFALVGVGVVILIVVLVVVLTRKKNDNTVVENPRPMPEPPSTPKKELSLYGVTGEYSNKPPIPITSVLILGRDPSKANVVYSLDTVGVSAVHCVIRRVGDTYELTDQQSTYGTFLGNGQRLSAGVSAQVKAGDTFYLGSREQMFRLG